MESYLLQTIQIPPVLQLGNIKAILQPLWPRKSERTNLYSL